MFSLADDDRACTRKQKYQQAFGIRASKEAKAHLRNCNFPTRPYPPTSSFTLFATLPVELRLLIWKFTLPDPRVFAVFGGNNATIGSSTKDPLMMKKAPSMPPQLHLCRESRQVAKEHYQYFFASLFPTKGIWFNFGKDAMHFETEQTLLKFLRIPKATIKSVLDSPPNNDTATDINTMISELRYLAVGADRGDYASTAQQILDFRKLDVLVLQNMDLNTSPSHPKQRRLVLEKRWKRARAEKANETGLIIKAPIIKWLGEHELSRLEKDGFLKEV